MTERSINPMAKNGTRQRGDVASIVVDGTSMSTRSRTTSNTVNGNKSNVAHASHTAPDSEVNKIKDSTHTYVGSYRRQGGRRTEAMSAYWGSHDHGGNVELRINSSNNTQTSIQTNQLHSAITPTLNISK
jgi:hypothetical protein